MNNTFLKQRIIEAGESIGRQIPEKPKRILKRFFYAGNRVYCPICKGRFRKFIPMFGRQNAMCPVCGSMERHRMIWLFLQKETRFFLKRNIRLFHLSPESAFRSVFGAMKNVHYVTGNLLYANAAVTLDAVRLPFRDDSFDAVLCCHVLEHIPDDQAAMREFFRVIRPGGWALLQHPVHFHREVTLEDPGVKTREERKRIFGQADHVRIYGRDMTGRLEQAGFNTIVHPYSKRFPEREKSRFGLKTDEYLMLCIKPQRQVA